MRQALPLLLLSCCIVAVIASGSGSAATPAPTAAPFSPTSTVTGSITSSQLSANNTFAVVSNKCFGRIADGNVSGSIAVSLSTSALSPYGIFTTDLRVAVFCNSNTSFPKVNPEIAANAALTCNQRLALAHYVSAAPTLTPTTATFAPISVVDNGESHTWYVTLVSCTRGVVVDSTAYNVVYTQASSHATQSSTCPAAAESSTEVYHGHSEHVSSKQVALVAAFGGIVWLFLVFYTFKKTCSQQYFSFSEFISTLPHHKWGSSSDSNTEQHQVLSEIPSSEHTALELEDDGSVDSSSSSSQGAAGSPPSSQRGHSKNARHTRLRNDPKVKERERLKQNVTNDSSMLATKAMPPRFAAAVGFFGILVVTGIWMSLLLAALKIENWPSYIGAAMGIILLALAGAWFYVKLRFPENSDQSERAVDELKSQLQIAVERAKEEIASELQEEMAHAHH